MGVKGQLYVGEVGETGMGLGHYRTRTVWSCFRGTGSGGGAGVMSSGSTLGGREGGGGKGGR